MIVMSASTGNGNFAKGNAMDEVKKPPFDPSNTSGQAAQGKQHDYAGNAAKADRYQEAAQMLKAKRDLGTLGAQPAEVRIWHELFLQHGGTITVLALRDSLSGWYWDGRESFYRLGGETLLEEDLPVVVYVTRDDPDLPEFLEAILK